MPPHSGTADQLCKRREGVTEHPLFSTIALTLVVVIALAVGASVVVWRIRSTGASSRYGLIAATVLVATAAIFVDYLRVARVRGLS
jgi:hypothetical protein